MCVLIENFYRDYCLSEVRVVVLSVGMKHSEIIAWAMGLLVGIGLTAAGVTALLEGL
jgi:hypothetical protein